MKLEEVDETARLILMDEPGGLISFSRQLREIRPDLSVGEVSSLWRKYRGFDGRLLPTHDYRTGSPIR